MDSAVTDKQQSSKSSGLYFRVMKNDHNHLSKVLSEDHSGFSGLVFDARYAAWHAELRQEIKQRRTDAILDTRALELALPGSGKSSLEKLKWAGEHARSAVRLNGPEGGTFVTRIAEFAVEHGFTSILSPNHFLASANSEWLHTDASLVEQLRVVLDQVGGKSIKIHYSLCTNTQVLFDPQARTDTIAAIEGLPIDSLWLKVHPFGSDKGHLSLRRYIEAARDLHMLEVPIIGDRLGTIGLPILAFGAVSGIESGIALGERFNISSWLKERKTDAKYFYPQPRVYASSIYKLLDAETASNLFNLPLAKAKFGCKDRACCKHGIQDMLRNPAQHFLITRMKEVAEIMAAPKSARAYEFLTHRLKPAAQLTAALAKKDPQFEKHQLKLEGWARSLDKVAAVQEKATISAFSTRPRPSRVVH
jgi:hypothetical protein